MRRFLVRRTMKNKVTATFVFALLVTGGLLAMYFLPAIQIDGYTLRKVDLLSDLRPEPIEEVCSDSDSLAFFRLLSRSLSILARRG